MIFYDFECYKYDWLVVLNDTESKTTTEIVNDSESLKSFYEAHKTDIWVGYNSRHYDQYILKAILCDFDPFDVTEHIIKKKQGGWNYSRLFMKIKLYNFDIMTDKFKGLKQLEGFMGSSIKETSVSFDTDRKLTPEEIQEVLQYCRHDVEQTMLVFIERIEEFESQLSLIKAFKLPLSHMSKTKAQLAAIILDAKKQNRDDEFEITLPDTLRIEKYRNIVEWYLVPMNYSYDKSLVIDVAGVPHTFAWGGIHGAIPNYQGSGLFLNIDVASYYPALMIEYGFASRNIADPDKYRQIRDERLRLKAEKNPMQAPYKIVLNSTYGAMKDQYNQLYDPLQANNVCVGGQLLLLDLIEQIEPVCQLIQSNTDGLLIKVEPEEVETVKELCLEWQVRTRMVLEFEEFERVYQKDVNNYIVVMKDGSYKSKGAYVKKLDSLDYDLPIVNRAVVDYFVHDKPVDETINSCNRLIEFQKIVKVSEKYGYGTYGGKRLAEKVLRVFASRSHADPGVFKVKEGGRIEKIANTPERCFIENGDIRESRIPRKLDKKWYIDTAKKRIADFLGEKMEEEQEWWQDDLPF